MIIPSVAISIRQPWAGLLISRKKTIEVRTWSTFRRGWVYIHAATIVDEREIAWKWVSEEIKPYTKFRGGLIGMAHLRNCIKYSNESDFSRDQSKHLNDLSWFSSPMYGFEFTNLTPIDFRVLPGQLRFFPVLPLNTENK